jgi:hypothetical protein
MARIPSDIEEQVIQEDERLSAPPTPSAQEHHDRSARILKPYRQNHLQDGERVIGP